jgi:putative iron-only hydrogenase system regulator
MIHTITIILPTNELSDEINGILHNYANIILGRIGLPRVDENEFIMTVIIKAEKEKIEKIFNEINSIGGIKSDYLTIK